MNDYIDEIEITISSGNGGNGITSFRREKFVPFGGPDGGDGGNGGNVLFQGSSNLDSFKDLTQTRFFKAQNGGNGKGSNKNGKKGNDIIIKVPLGTEIKDKENNVTIIDVIENDKIYLALSGGIGGKGNSNFKTSKNQSPRKATMGKPGMKKKLFLNLKTLSDIGIVGFPNVGKSSIINLITNSKAEIGDYAFTTLSPNLGVIKTIDSDYLIADIPGIVEDASKGKGLGIKFLKHIERSRNIVIVLNGSCDKKEDLIDEFKKLTREIKLYSTQLLNRIKLIIINKSDLCLFKNDLKNFRIDGDIHQILFSCKECKKEEINFLKENFLL